MNPRIERLNGLDRILRPDQTTIRASKDLSGGIKITIGQTAGILSPRKAFDLATGILNALGYSFEKKPDDLPE